jgi:MFS superfamily sulfate permease-like transporter
MEPATVATWGAVIAGVATSLALFARRVSRDRTEIAKDRAEQTSLAKLLAERDTAITESREFWRLRQLDGASIARLENRCANQQREIKRLQLEFASFRRMVVRAYPEIERWLESDFVPLRDEG